MYENFRPPFPQVHNYSQARNFLIPTPSYLSLLITHSFSFNLRHPLLYLFLVRVSEEEQEQEEEEAGLSVLYATVRKDLGGGKQKGFEETSAPSTVLLSVAKTPVPAACMPASEITRANGAM